MKSTDLAKLDKPVDKVAFIYHFLSDNDPESAIQFFGDPADRLQWLIEHATIPWGTGVWDNAGVCSLLADPQNRVAVADALRALIFAVVGWEPLMGDLLGATLHFPPVLVEKAAA